MTFYGKDISGLHADLVAKKVSATELTKAPLTGSRPPMTKSAPFWP